MTYDEKELEVIKSLFEATSIPKNDVPLLTMFVQTLKPYQIDAVHEVLYQLIWERKMPRM